MTAGKTALPRWRGFNLLEMFTTKQDGNFREDDFRWMAEWGFDFVRLPMCYLLWTEQDDVFKVREEMLEKIDRAVDLGRTCGLHVCLNFHRAPGYSVNPGRAEPFNLWKDADALEAFCFHWQIFARRYRGIPSDLLSFNLVNEPTAPSERMTREDHERVVRGAVEAIQQIDPDRLIIADGLNWGNDPLPELDDLPVAQSCRAYIPTGISHYKAEWSDIKDWPAPAWPGGWSFEGTWDRQRLRRHYERWAELARKGVGVHCGEGGAYNKTPHEIVLRWLRDCLEILTSLEIGYALWNFRGPFGILDSGRTDVDYEDFRGHKLDGKLLRLLQEF